MHTCFAEVSKADVSSTDDFKSMMGPMMKAMKQGGPNGTGMMRPGMMPPGMQPGMESGMQGEGDPPEQ